MTFRRPRLDAATARIRVAVRSSLEARVASRRVDSLPVSIVAVAISGGADSLALAAATAFEAPKLGLAVCGIIVDHGLQQGSGAVAGAAADAARRLGVSPVCVRRVDVVNDGSGPESAARQARYDAIAAVAAEHGASDVLLGHTRDDQAESVLLGLARGAGAASLAGMRPVSARGDLTLLRPLLDIPRADTVASCAALGIDPWHDPQNEDPRFLRVRIRTHTLPSLDADLGPGVTGALARTARLLADDTDYLDAVANAEFTRLAVVGEVADGAPHPRLVSFDRSNLASLHPAIRHRIYRLAAAKVSDASLGLVHVDDVDRMVMVKNSPTHRDLPGTTVVRVRTQVLFYSAQSCGEDVHGDQ